MAESNPPYHTPVYIKNVLTDEVLEVTQDSSGNRVLDVDIENSAASSWQVWNLDPWQMDQNQYFVKLNDDSSSVVNPPQEEGGQAFMKLQGDVNRNGGIQVWILEPVPGAGPNMWALKNYKTGWYLYVDKSDGQPKTKIPVIAGNASVDDKNAQWLIVET